MSWNYAILAWKNHTPGQVESFTAETERAAFEQALLAVGDKFAIGADRVTIYNNGEQGATPR